jgi:putative transposase
VYHVLNRANGRQQLFFTDADYLAFLKVLEQARQRYPGIEVFSFCIMPNHWHLVVRASKDGELSLFMRWLTQTHTQRWRHAKRTVGYGALYQGRFKSFIVQEDGHFLTLCRYVERNPLRAKRPLARRAEQWRWSSAGLWRTKEGEALLNDWPVERPRNWLRLLNEPQTDAEQEQVQQSLLRNRPLGNAAWTERIVRRLQLQYTIRPPGRPRKVKP